MCGIDQPSKGTLPGFVFYFMVIHFLQQCDPPVLPVLQEDLPQYFSGNKTMDELNPDNGEFILSINFIMMLLFIALYCNKIYYQKNSSRGPE